MQQNKSKKALMLEALEQSLGVVSMAVKSVGINRVTHYRWLDSDPKYRKSVEDLEDVRIDFAEHALHKKIKEGDNASIIFFLKTKGKKRGYVERTEVEDLGTKIIKVVRE